MTNTFRCGKLEKIQLMSPYLFTPPSPMKILMRVDCDSFTAVYFTPPTTLVSFRRNAIVETEIPLKWHELKGAKSFEFRKKWNPRRLGLEIVLLFIAIIT